MPKYLQKACLHKPQYNITIPNIVDEQTLRQMNERSKSEVLESTNKIFERLPKSVGKYYLLCQLVLSPRTTKNQVKNVDLRNFFDDTFSTSSPPCF